MATTSIEIDRPAEQVYDYVTDPTKFHEWQQGVVSGGIKEPGPAAVGAHCQNGAAHRREGPTLDLGPDQARPAN